MVSRTDTRQARVTSGRDGYLTHRAPQALSDIASYQGSQIGVAGGVGALCNLDFHGVTLSIKTLHPSQLIAGKAYQGANWQCFEVFYVTLHPARIKLMGVTQHMAIDLLYGAGRAWETVVWLKREIDRNYSPNPETGGPEAWRLVPRRQALKAMAVAPLWIGATLLVAAALVAALSAFAWVFTTGLAG